MKKIVISEEQYKHILEETNTNNYKLQDFDELFGYMWLRPQKTNLNVDLFIDDGEAYIRDGHVPLLFVRNGYNKAVDSFIPISIYGRPTVLDNEIDIKISQEDLFNVFGFIEINQGMLLGLANKEITLDNFRIKKAVPVMAEQTLIQEMATLTSQQSDLPMDVWLDEGIPSQHGPRLKFRASREQRNTRDFSSMSLTNPPTSI